MAILQRTPPARRPVAGTEAEPVTSSPSRSRLMRSAERQTETIADTYVFPSLESMAAQQQAAKALAPRNSPAIALSSRTRESVGASGASMGTSSANSRKVMGGQVGRNGPILTSTVAKSHPAIGESRNISIQSPLKSSIPRLKPSPTKAKSAEHRSSSVVSRDPSPANVFQNGRHEAAPRSRAQASVDGIFEAQMERALASGADPFQDRKKDLMRGESRMPGIQQEEPVVNGPRRSFLQSAELIESEEADCVVQGTDTSATTPKAAPQSPVVRTRIPVAQSLMHSPANRSSNEVILKLKAQIEEKANHLENARAEVTKAQKALNEKDQLNRQHRDTIKALERRIVDVSSKDREIDIINLRLVAFEWESLRDKCRYTMARGEESRDREIDAIISRNEFTYMDARRGENELDLKMMQYEAESVKQMLEHARIQHHHLESSLEYVKSEKEGLEQEQETFKSNEKKVKEALKSEKQRSEDLEYEVRVLQEKLAKEEIENRRLKQRQAFSPVRKAVTVGETQKSSPSQRIRERNKENVAPIKASAVTASKSTRTVSETLRQSPRKISAFVKSTSARIQSSVMRQSDGISDDEQEEETPKVVAKSKQVAAKVKRKASIQKDEDESEVEKEVMEASMPKKKAGILSRAKTTTEKKVTATSSKRKSDSREEEQRSMDLSQDVQQTPMILAKKKKGKLEIERADESLDAEATPVVKPKSGKLAAPEPVEEATKTPVIRSKKRKEDTEGTSTSVIKRVDAIEEADNGVQKKKKRRILKQNTNIANGFLNINGDGEGGLDPELNLPLQLSPLKGNAPTSSITSLGTRGAANRVFGR